jgi:trans-2,3-dihydro-3-hydroxyanthranilate isomerase
MRTLRFKQVDAFTTKTMTGNPAGVVLDARGLGEQTMQAIAREANLSETAFILPPTLQTADLQIRWFTPSVEVPLCGHATIASFHALAEEGMAGMKRSGQYSFRLQTKSGLLPIVVDKRHSGTVVEMGIPVPRFKVHRKLPEVMSKALGLKVPELVSRIPVVSHSYLYIPVRSLRKLKQLHPDFRLLKEECERRGFLGVSVFSLRTVEESSAVHSRFFAPAAGIDEDPVTGSANGPLGAYLYQFALREGFGIPWLQLPDGRMEFIGEQGDIIGRRGRVKIRLSASNRVVKQLSIAGEAVTVMDATFAG